MLDKTEREGETGRDTERERGRKIVERHVVVDIKSTFLETLYVVEENFSK